MLAIRLQRVGRKGYAQYRLIAQDAQRSPRSGRVIANIGSYNPHTKAVQIDKESVSQYLQNGAQPSPRVVRLLQAEGMVMPDWVEPSSKSKKRSVKHANKLRKNKPAAPAEAVAPTEEEAPAEAAAESTTEAEATPDESSE